jgi:hypothetical protein
MRWLVALCFVFSTGCQSCKGNPERCDRAARNYAELVYWEGANAEIAKLPAEQRDAARKQKMAEFAANMSKGIDLVVSKCVSANNKDQVDCMINAKTVQAVKACIPKE